MSGRPIALVTGAARGIGRACAEALAGAGYDLALFDRDHADAAAAACRDAGAKTLVLRRDLADIEEHAATVGAILARFGRLDALVNNAGIASPVRGDLLALEPHDFDTVLSVNLRGTIFLSQAVARHMVLDGPTERSRAIVTVTSVSAEMANPDRAAYCVSKAALAMWLKALAVRLAPSNVGVFEVRPGLVRTDMTAAVAGRYDALIAEGFVPARRWGEPDDVARAVVALARPDLGFCTGSVVHVDGGLAVPRF